MDITDLKGQFSLKEFLVDFFGSLMPGVLFLLFILLSFFPSIISSISILQYKEGNYNQVDDLISEIIKFIISVSSVTILSFFIIFLAVGYVIGTLFYRRDPKYPDYRSFIKTASKFSKKELAIWVVRVKWKDIEAIRKKLKKLKWNKKLYHYLFTLQKTEKALSETRKNEYIDNPKLINILTVDESDVQYPYNNLKEFLKVRGREDLAKRICWTLETESNEEENNMESKITQRSKIFINSLKIRLQFRHPEKCGTINKNEAHIRLSSSMWYASTGLIKSSILGLIILTIAMFIAKLTYSGILVYIFPIVLNIGVIYLAYIFRRNSEKFLHYQRVREIYYVIETAELANEIDKKEYRQEYYFKGV